MNMFIRHMFEYGLCLNEHISIDVTILKCVVMCRYGHVCDGSHVWVNMWTLSCEGI